MERLRFAGPLVNLKDLKGLVKLHLEKTKVTDEGLQNLTGLENLEYLNLYGTEVTDAGLKDLVFGGWDIFKDTAYEAAANAGVLSKEDLCISNIPYLRTTVFTGKLLYMPLFWKRLLDTLIIVHTTYWPVA